MEVRRSERLLPVLRAALSGVLQEGRTRHHAALKFRRKALDGGLRYAERLQSLAGDGQAHPGVARAVGRVRGGVHDAEGAAHQLASSFPVVDPQPDVGGSIGTWPRSQYTALNVAQFKLGPRRIGHVSLQGSCKVASVHRLGQFAISAASNAPKRRPWRRTSS